LAPAFDLHHIFGGVGDWFYLQGSRKRPTVLTMVTDNPPVDALLLRRIDRFVVEYPGGEKYLQQLGIDQRRIRLILPPVDLSRFAPSAPPESPFTILFASSPDQESWLDARGVPQILDAAALRPGMRFRMLWRPWGNSQTRIQGMIAERGLCNVELAVGCFSNMPHQYNSAHVTIAPFTDMSRSKSAPNSLIESMACGRPVLVTKAVGLSGFIREGGAGIVCAATGEALAEHLDQLEADWAHYSKRARRLAERWFGVDRFLDRYARLYDEAVAC
jgi:glycosyltransferase involved in cell wall biosynthesis